MALLRKINKIIFINFGRRKQKKLLFCSYFQHIALCFYPNLDLESSLDVEFDSASNKYPHCILLTDLTTPKTRNTWKRLWWCYHHVFSGISSFWGSRAIIITFFQVFLVFGVARPIKSMSSGFLLIPHPRTSHEQDLSKNTGRYVKNMKKKIVFFFSSSKINKYYFINFP